MVMAADVAPEIAMHDLKAYASRFLNERETTQKKRWARHGSTRYLWKRNDVDAVVHYEWSNRGEPMAIFWDYRSITVAARKG
jgi:hypothetical protein